VQNKTPAHRSPKALEGASPISASSISAFSQFGKCRPRFSFLPLTALVRLTATFGRASSSFPRPVLFGSRSPPARTAAIVLVHFFSRAAFPTQIRRVLGLAALDVFCARSLGQNRRARAKLRQLTYDYGDRSGFPRPAREMRGAARSFEIRLRHAHAGAAANADDGLTPSARCALLQKEHAKQFSGPVERLGLAERDEWPNLSHYPVRKVRLRVES
jgi:hypothetical protein